MSCNTMLRYHGILLTTVLFIRFVTFAVNISITHQVDIDATSIGAVEHAEATLKPCQWTYGRVMTE